MIVVDASAIVEILLLSPVGRRLESRLFAPGETLHAPQLVDVEVAHALRRYYLAGAMSPWRGQAALEVLADMPLTRHRHTLFMPRIWELRDSLTAHDAAYVALAEFLEAPLITRDGALARSSGHTAVVELV
jgi:predicted nucleic acid-binding protein